MKKILLFSRDPGGSNTIIPLVEPLQKRGYEVRLFGKDIALEKYRMANLSGFNIMNYISSIKLDFIKNFITDEEPDFIITGTSANDFTEKYIWKAAGELKIPSFAILDQWVNYGVRFSNYGISQLDDYNKDKNHSYVPSKICVMDDIAESEAINEGLEQERIIITGQPYFEIVLKKSDSITNKAIKSIRDKAGLSINDFLITFASEPISDTYNENDFSEHYWGYTERTIFRELLDVILQVSKLYPNKIGLIIRQHPKENSSNFSDIIDNFKSSRIKIIINRDFDQHELIMASDLICGMSSMFLIEAAILDKLVMSIQIGLKRENPLILDRVNCLKSILDKQTLLNVLRLIIMGENTPRCYFNIIKNPVENVILQMEKMLCQNLQ